MTIFDTRNLAPERLKRLGLLSRISLLFLTLVFGNSAWALEFRCEAPGDVRTLRVEVPGQEKLCEVSVSYEATGERRVMWHASNDTMFCSAQAYALKDKYIAEWNFDCAALPDHDGIDNLSPTHRGILDNRLKSLISRGQAAIPSYTVTSVIAKASSQLDKQPSALALQFFLSNGDVTEVILDEGGDWELFATIDNLATHITGGVPAGIALIDSITDTGALEISTTINADAQQPCYGTQVLMVSRDNQLHERTPHRFICAPSSALNDAR